MKDKDLELFKLIADNKVLKKCVEFYANSDNWSDPEGYYESVTCDEGDEARKTLKEIN